METISNIAVTARKSVFGETPPTTQSGTEPPTGDTPGKGTADAPHDPGNIPEQIPTQPGVEPPSGGPEGKGTAEAPFDRGNEPEQIQVTGKPADTTSATEPLPSSSIPTSKIDNPDPSVPSDMKAAVASNDADNSINKTISSTPSSETDSKSKKTGTAKPGSHSALFGLGPKDESSSSGTKAIHPPKGAGEISGTIDEAGEELGQQAEIENRGTSEDDTGGYVGLKKAAMEEEEKRRNGGAGAEPTGWAAATSTPGAAAVNEERVPRSVEKKNSLGREISPGEMPDGTHRKSIAEGMPTGHTFGRKTTTSNGEKSGGFRDRLKDKFRSKNK